MGQITLRGIDPEIENRVRKISKSTGKSLNRVIQEIIYQHIGGDQKTKKPAAYSLRKLAGGWSEQEASDFFASVQSFDRIDETMWR